MYKFVLENRRGDQLVFNELGGAFTIDEIQGLAPASATINTSEGAYIDGQLFNSSKVNMRTLEIAFAIENDAAQNRIEVYKVLKPKQEVRAYYSSSVRNVYIDGYVESVEITHYDMKQICTVAILCPAPFWQSAQTLINELTTVQDAFHFPFASTAHDTVSLNLAPFFSAELPESGGSNEWWQTVSDEITALSDGWAHIECDNTSGSALKTISFYPAAVLGIVANETYTVMFEVRNCVVSQAVGIISVAGAAKQLLRVSQGIQGDGIYYCVKNARSDVSSSTMLADFRIAVAGGVSISMDLRMSLYKGEYTGEYVPYAETGGEIVFAYLDPTASVTVENDGDVQTGIIIELYASNTISNPKIWDYTTLEFIGLNFTMQPFDKITIDTRAGEKTVKLLRNGVTTNIFNSLDKNSSWLQLDFGGSVYAYEVGTGIASDLVVSISHTDLYEGV